MFEKRQKSFHRKKSSRKYKDDNSDAGSELDQIKIDIDTKLEAAKWTFLEYFKESSIHGFKYIGNRQKQAIPDRVLWLIALVLSILASIYYIGDIWYQRNNNPAVISFSEKQTHIWEIPFPTVTVCRETKSNTEVFNFTKIFWKLDNGEDLTDDELFHWEAIAQLCSSGFVLEPKNYSRTFVNGSELKEAMTQAEPRCMRDYEFIEFKNQDASMFSERFQRVITADGICFSFNSLKSVYYRDELKSAEIQDDEFYNNDIEQKLNWNVETGYNVTDLLDTVPERVTVAGKTHALVLYLTSFQQDIDFLCRNADNGIKVTLHTPGEEPQVTKNFLTVPFETSVTISIKPKIMTAFDGLQSYEPRMRQCYFQHERYLRYFKVYSQTNCQIECIANETLKSCGCVKFSMPRNATQNVCGTLQAKCIHDAENNVTETNFKALNNQHAAGDSNNFTSLCRCLPLCSSVQYKAEFGTINDFDYSGYFRALNLSQELKKLPGIQITQIKINFKEDQFNGLKRTEYCSRSDFIASCGGLLGLFMGVSILSVVELVYFFTIKLWTNLKKRKMKNKKIRKFKEAP